ncbi:MAG: methyltransferase [bacterium]
MQPNSHQYTSWYVHKLPVWMKAIRPLRPVASTIYAAITLHFRKKNAVTKVAGLRLKTMLDVGHPRFSPESKLLIRHLDTLPLQNKHVLDVGTGSGIIGVFAAKKGAKVLAVDVNPLAVQLARENAILHGVEDKMQALEGDLFSKVLPVQRLDYIIINPVVCLSKLESFTQSATNEVNNSDTIARFLEQAQAFLAEKGKMILIFNSEMPLCRIDKKIRQSGFIIASIKQSMHVFGFFYIFELQVA